MGRSINEERAASWGLDNIPPESNAVVRGEMIR
jgi:hypothetical protein